MPRLRLIAGPNGAGKTSLLKTLIKNKIPVGQYINPDDIARHIALEKAFDRANREYGIRADFYPREASLQNTLSALLAQAIATGLRDDWLNYELSMTYESVMSHDSHLQFVDAANDAGFEPYLYYICTSDPELNIERVEQRVQSGGHSVPKDKIKKRYFESLKRLHSMASKCRRVYFFDNSGQEHIHFAEIIPNGYLDIFEKQFDKAQPLWFVEHFLQHWPKAKIRLAHFQ